jgi:hypothetical protein
MSKRRKGYPSETNVRVGVRIVHGDKLLVEKLGRNDLCPLRQRTTVQAVLSEIRPLLTASTVTTIFREK